jgi:hypothetical protein
MVGRGVVRQARLVKVRRGPAWKSGYGRHGFIFTFGESNEDRID